MIVKRVASCLTFEESKTHIHPESSYITCHHANFSSLSRSCISLWFLLAFFQFSIFDLQKHLAFYWSSMLGQGWHFLCWLWKNLSLYQTTRATSIKFLPKLALRQTLGQSISNLVLASKVPPFLFVEGLPSLSCRRMADSWFPQIHWQILGVTLDPSEEVLKVDLLLPMKEKRA